MGARQGLRFCALALREYRRQGQRSVVRQDSTVRSYGQCPLPRSLANITADNRNLKPGGWVEIQDILPKASSDDGTVPPNYPLNKFYSTLGDILQEQYQFDLWIVQQLPELLQRLGYVNVQKKVFHMPVGEWARDKHLRLLGGYFREVLRDFVGAMAARPLVEAGFEKDEIEEQVNNITSTMSNRRFHAYMPIHFVWAQKPAE